MNFKTLSLTLLLSAILVLTPTLYTVNAQSETQPFFMFGVQHPYSYTFFKEGSYYYAKNSYGRTVYSGTNATYVSLSSWNTLTSGGTVFYTKAVYDFDTSLSIPYNNIAILLEQGTVFRATGNINIILLNDKNRTLISGGEFDGNKASYSSQGIKGTTSNSRIENVYFHDFSENGIFAINCTNLIIDGVISKYNDQRGMYVTTTGANLDQSDYCKIINCHTESNGARGISLSASINTIVQGCTSINDGLNYPTQGASGDGIHLEAQTSIHNFECIVDSNIIVGNHRHAIHVVSYTNAHSSRHVISNNVIENPNNVSIRVYRGSEGYLENVIIEGNQIIGGTHGILVGGYYPRQVSIYGNIISNTTDYGIFLKADNCSVSNNLISNTTYGIYAEGHGNFNSISSNQIHNASYGIYTYGMSPPMLNTSIFCNTIFDSSTYDIYLSRNTDYTFCALNHVDSIRIAHTTYTCDYNRFFANYVTNLTQSSGSPSGNTYIDNYPDNTP